jgi:hypothetical protein
LFDDISRTLEQMERQLVTNSMMLTAGAAPRGAAS